MPLPLFRKTGDRPRSVTMATERTVRNEAARSCLSAYCFPEISFVQRFIPNETHACIHNVAGKHCTLLVQGFMQQSADPLKGSRGYPWISTRKHLSHPNATGDITSCQTGHAIYIYSVTLCIIVE